VHHYEAANPGVKLEWVDFPWDLIQAKLVSRIVAGNPPALVNLNLPWADEFARFSAPVHVALVAKQAASYQAGGLLRDGLFAEDNFPAAIDAYKGGRLGMLLAPPTALKRIQGDAADICAITGVAPAPLGPTGIAAGGWLIHFAVPANVKPALLPAVARFARDLTNDADQLAFARLASVHPAMAQAANDPFFASVAPGAGAAEKAVPAGALSMPHARTLYVAGIEDYDELRRYLVKAVEAGVTGKQGIQQAPDQAVAIWNKKLAASRSR
jgi:putative chitobiose transport system substrate-binding protein